jgi:hypothetical protein
MSPPVLTAGVHYLSLVNLVEMASDEASTELPYIFDRPSTIYGLNPKHGSSSGNTTITIQGGPFRSTGHYLLCRFGDAVVPAYFYSEILITCVTPMHRPGRVMVEITQNGVDYIQTEQSFTFHEQVLFNCIQLWSGPALQVSVLRIFGSGFYHSPSSVCRIGSATESKLVYVTEGELQCQVPALLSEESSEWIALPRHFTQKQSTKDLNNGETFIYPLYKALIVTIDVSLNGQEYFLTGLKFLYQAEINVIDISRTDGPSIGRTPVFIFGAGFVNSTLLTCRYAKSSIRAIFLTRNIVLCPSPALLMDHNLHYSTSVTLGVSNNGDSFASLSTLFSYFARLDSGKYQSQKDL